MSTGIRAGARRAGPRCQASVSPPGLVVGRPCGKVEQISLRCQQPSRDGPETGVGATVNHHERDRHHPPQHPADRLRPGAPTRLAPAGCLPDAGGTGSGPRASSSPTATPTPRRAPPVGASLFTGRYLEGHGVLDNVIMPEHEELPPATPTLGSLLDGAGYRSSYIGKWHLSHSPTPDMASYGFADWDGNDRHFMGWAGTGVHFDPLIASNAAHWLSRECRADPRRDRGPRRRSLVPDRGPGEHARRHVAPGGPARLPGGPPRRRGRHPFRPRIRRLDGRRPAPHLHRPLPRGGRPAHGQLRRRPPHQARGATGRDGRTSSTACAGTSTPRTREPGSASSTTTSTSTSWPTRAWARCSRPWSNLGGLGRHSDHRHLRPRRHVLLARAPLHGALRLRRDHAGAPLPAGAQGDHPRLGHRLAGLPRGPGRHHLLPDLGGPRPLGRQPCRVPT